MASRRTGSTRTKKNSRPESRAEWVIAAVAAIAVLSLTGYLLFEALTKTGTLPDIVLAPTQISEASEGYLVSVSAINRGHATAADVEIEAVMDGAEGAIRSHVRLDYLPAESEARIVLAFPTEPDPETLQLRVLGFREP